VRRGFTLIELLVALAILGFLVAAMVRIEWGLKESLERLTERGKKELRLAKGLFLLHEDLLRATKLQITDYGRYSALRLQTANSIYGIERPWVLWYVSKEDDTLMRIESSVQIHFPVADYERYYCYPTAIATGCSGFALSQSKDRQRIFVQVTFSQKEPIFFAVTRPHGRKKSQTSAPPPPSKARPKKPGPTPISEPKR